MNTISHVGLQMAKLWVSNKTLT